jgi:hypothetical protein
MMYVLNLTVKEHKREWMRLDGDYHYHFYVRIKELIPKEYRRYIHFKSPDTGKNNWYWEIDPAYFCRVFELAWEYFDTIYLDEHGRIDVFKPVKKEQKSLQNVAEV